MPAEQFGYLVEKLINEGAHDVYMTPIIMKKTRPATKISVLCSPKDELNLTNILLIESSTLGIRSYEVQKTMLGRKKRTINTEFGNIEVKIALLNNEEIKLKPEYEQCKVAAEKYNVPLRKVIETVINKANQ